MASTFHGYMQWSMERDQEGHRTYTLVTRVNCLALDGPYTALNTPGLFLPGSVWALANDLDIWAFCQPDAQVAPVMAAGKPNLHFDITQRFTTKPPPNNRCQDQQVEDPLLEPPKVSGSFIKTVEESTKDRFGNAITNSAHEQIRGPQVEFDSSLPQIVIEQNVATAEQGYILPAQMRDTVNDAPLWGLPARCIRMSEPTWTRNYYGQCLVYYTRRLVFDVNVRVEEIPEAEGGGTRLVSGFDRDLLDEGTRVLSGHWDDTLGLRWVLDDIAGERPDKTNPRHFIRYKDRYGENDKVILDGEGQPYNPETATTDECTECPGGSPEQWHVAGLEEFITDVDLLTHDGECRWEGRAGLETGANTLVLEYVDADSRWVLSGNTLTATYSKSGASWVCMGPNVMTRLTGNETDGPASITVTNSGGEPGNIHVEHYTESNFLQLGIPAIF